MTGDKFRSPPASAVRSGTQSLFRSFALGSVMLKKQTWIWPIAAAALLAVLGWYLRNTIESKLKSRVASELETIVKADAAALRLWMRSQETICRGEAANPHLVVLTGKLAALAAKADTTQLQLLQAPEQEAVRAELNPVLEAQGYVGYMVADTAMKVIASQRNELVGVPVPQEDQPALSRKSSSNRLSEIMTPSRLKA